MLPACGLELRGNVAAVMKGDEWFAGTWRVKGTDAGDGNIGDLARNAHGCWRGEEELVVFATMQCSVECILAGEFGGKRVKGKRGGIDLGTEPRGFAEMRKVCGETVTEIDGGRGKAATEERGTHCKAWLGIEMRMTVGCRGARAMRLLEECRKLGVRAAE